MQYYLLLLQVMNKMAQPTALRYWFLLLVHRRHTFCSYKYSANSELASRSFKVPMFSKLMFCLSQPHFQGTEIILSIISFVIVCFRIL